MVKPRSRLTRIGIDILGVLCLITAILFGWIPGPGGIPLLLAGLGLLSINHEWARRWLQKMRDSGNKINDFIFPDKPIIKILYDVISFLATGAALYLLYRAEHNFVRAVALLLLIIGLSIFLLNRQRLARMTRRVKNSS